jgi:hypothetical protein
LGAHARNHAAMMEDDDPCHTHTQNAPVNTKVSAWQTRAAPNSARVGQWRSCKGGRRVMKSTMLASTKADDTTSNVRARRSPGVLGGHMGHGSMQRRKKNTVPKCGSHLLSPPQGRSCGRCRSDLLGHGHLGSVSVFQRWTPQCICACTRWVLLVASCISRRPAGTTSVHLGSGSLLPTRQMLSRYTLLPLR